MCDIWRAHNKQTMSINTFENIIERPFFSSIQHIGISGGEPSLVENLVDYYRIAIKKLPNLSSISIIFNCINIENTVNASFELYQFACKHNIAYKIMLSIDGIGKIHDINRGTSGNFNNACKVIDELSANRIAFCAGTTVTKNNVWNVDELLSFFLDKNIHGYFRVAEFINRLDNHKCTNFIRNFSINEIYQLSIFFYKLILTYEENNDIKNTYHNIINVLHGGNRIISCPYARGIAINLDQSGSLTYCAPKGQPFAVLPRDNAEYAYKTNYFKLNEIKNVYCEQCIHDYHDMPLDELITKHEKEEKWKKYFTIQSYLLNNSNLLSSLWNDITTNNNKTVFVIGWYGTETVGDKAILKGIVDYYRSKGDFTFAISSLYPFITERTIYELNIEASVIPVYSEKFFQYSASSYIICVGGGPLMELEELSLIMWAFKTAKRHNKKTHIFGCGIGPLYTDEKKNAVKEILTLADTIELRDKKSKELALEMYPLCDISVIPDPSVKVISEQKIISTKKNSILACYFRELTLEYRSNMTTDIFLEFKEQFEKALAENVRLLCTKHNLIPHFYSMHNFVVGNDDRDFNYRFAKTLSDINPYVENKLSTVENIAIAMQNSIFNLCMRFHSVVFAYTLGVPFVAIDYTSGGKIHSFMDDHNMLNMLINMNEMLTSKDALNIIYEKEFKQKNV